VDIIKDAYANSLRERKGSAWESYKNIVDIAGNENRDLTAEERETLERVEADLDAIHAEEQRHAQRVASVNLADSIRESVAPVKETSVKPQGPMSDTDTLRSLTNVGDFAIFDASRHLETRALGDTQDGGSAVRTNFADQLVVYERTLNPMLQVARVIDTGQDRSPLTVPRLTADPAHGGTVTAEGGAINELDPTLSTVSLNSYKMGIITLISRELWDSNYVDLADMAAESAARELNLDFGTWYTTGNNTGQPNGVVTAAGNGGTAGGVGGSGSTAVSAFFGSDDLVSLYFSVAAPYRTVGSWMVSEGAHQKIRKFKDAQGHYLYDPVSEGIVTGLFGSLLGRPMYTNPAMATPASASKSVLFGDFSRYWIKRTSPRVERSVDYKFGTDQVALRVIVEGDGDLIDTAAINYLVSADT
jgi:HK97 family phage major capsid protein